ncbi:hypothetical protein ACFV8E_35095 [Streptomyces sp. NPDC059849]|uniref:hypothetical protein n=1 Tax=Streptomyces sp. NPDC059849 TaxID=3346969 RepID=UPI003655E419
MSIPADSSGRMVGLFLVGVAAGSEGQPRGRGRGRACAEYASGAQFVEVGQALSGESVEQVGLGGEEAVRRVALEHIEQFATAEGRHELCVELLRLGALQDFEAMHASTQWRSYIALHATFLSLADDALQGEVQAALAAAEQELNDRIAQSYARLAALFGLRLRPCLHTSFDELATHLNATMRGFVLTAMARPDLARRQPKSGVLDTNATADWSPPALGVAATALAYLEPDPAVTWDARHVAAVRDALPTMAQLSPTSPSQDGTPSSHTE